VVAAVVAAAAAVAVVAAAVAVAVVAPAADTNPLEFIRFLAGISTQTR